ncbi:hypothetical protein HG535_0A00770 [Zygotorulaspora mrakii]|uniref:Swi6 N-terminal domain-containing protein n=1 Tax=Zygotorulaspora mrakii TaxID=42260 RepID=A0A7H9AV37_ZYGMR|nr:uncharacterized protein HG535_0A00770 [Zygotorulaspora mrakii]QLG70138.1 hypothetical protein HG535_0A00770 [Zygotorulaspora mrakii]
MSVLEVTKLIGEQDFQLPLTLKRNNSTGYFLLRPFLPLLQSFNRKNDGNEDSSDAKGDEELNNEQEDEILSQFGILVDTDDQGKKWITSEKAVELLKKLNLFHLFEAELGSNLEVNEGSSRFDSLDKSQPEVNSDGKKSQNSIIGEEDIKMDANDHRSLLGNSTSSSIVNHPVEVIKRHNDEINGKNANELASPLKKSKIDNFSPKEMNSNAPHESLDSNVSSKKIRTFNHDLNSEMLKQPLRLQKTQKAPQVSNNNQRVKLETFLQRLLFPAIQDISSSNNSSQPLSFELALQEVENSYPDIPLNLNIPVDERGNTPLHWLSSIANLELVKYLVEHGTNRLLGDNLGESALVKAVKSVNNYDSGTFEKLLDHLYPCLILEDSMNRSILHHIVITSGMPGCSSAAKYYLDILMGWIVKKQSRVIEGAGSDIILETLDLKWVISNMLNAPDSNGDTCLNIASRLGNVSIVDALLDYGADPYVANKSGLRPADFGAGTSKLYTNGTSNAEKQSDKLSPHETSTDVNVPDTISLVEGMQSLLATVSKDYATEVKEHQDKLNKLHKELNSHREVLAASRDRLAHAKQLQDEHAILKEQLGNIRQGVVEEEQKFKEESRLLGLSSEDTAGADWDSSEFDADEPFRVDFVYEILENKLANDYNGSVDKLLESETIDSMFNEVRSAYYFHHQDNEKLDSMLPPSVLLSARINAYKRNDAQLNSTLEEIRRKQKVLESKFRRVLCLCLKIDEDKVDGMLDGLLQAISSEDPQDVDTDEMQEFLNKHNT